MKKPYKKTLNAGGYMSEKILIKLDKSELELIKSWGTQFVLMAKQKFVRADTLEVQKSQQLLDTLADDPSPKMVQLAKIAQEKTELDNDIKYKDHPYAKIGEAYGGD